MEGGIAMSDTRPIGVFDSGLGGLSCIKTICKRMPNENVVYFGDTARTPYGDKARDTIIRFAIQIVEFLAHQDVKMILIACNTVSALCTPREISIHPHHQYHRADRAAHCRK